MLYIFSKDDEFLSILSEDTGLVTTHFKDYENHLIDEPFTFNVKMNQEYYQGYTNDGVITQIAGMFLGVHKKSDIIEHVSPSQFVEEENQVAFYDRENRLRLMRIKEINELYDTDDYIVEVTCEPSWLELYDHFIEDRRIENGTAQIALNRALEGSRYVGNVQVDLGLNTTNFYWIDAVEAIFKIIDTWGGSLVDTIELDENNEIIERKILIVNRLGADRGLLIQPDYNAETIERRTLSYPITAMYGQGASLEIEDEEGNHTGGYTRYITLEDVEWKRSKSEPVDKPKDHK